MFLNWPYPWYSYDKKAIELLEPDYAWIILDRDHGAGSDALKNYLYRNIYKLVCEHKVCYNALNPTEPQRYPTMELWQRIDRCAVPDDDHETVFHAARHLLPFYPPGVWNIMMADGINNVDFI